VVVLARLLRYRLIDRGWPVLKTMLGVKFLLLTIGGVLAIHYGPFPGGDDGSAMLTGLTLVAGMAVQNALQRVHLGASPPTTLMTGTTTQIMLDVGDLLQGVPADQKDAIHARLARMGQAVFAFALGCAMAALLYAEVSTWCFALPPLLALAAFLHRDASAGG
jgi:uncharacterized membrane protein YoaK (UPF0700 family)